MATDSIRSARQDPIHPSYDAVVIGSGIGGLTAASVLAKEGLAVAVLERHYVAGGFTHVFRRGDYEWDVGIHYIGGVSNPSSLLWKVFDYVSGGQLEWADMGPVYDQVMFGEERFEYRKGREAFIDGLAEQFPDADDRQAIRTYVDRVRTVARAAGPFFAEKAIPPMLAALVGGRMRGRFGEYAARTTREVLEEITSNERLIGVLTAQYGDYGAPPRESSFAMHAMVAYHYMEGAAFPVGGCSRIAETIADVIAAAGGGVWTNAPVERILVERGRACGVKLEDGREVTAPIVISGAGVANTYGRLLPEKVRKQFGIDTMARSVRPSVGHLAVYAGFRSSAAELGLQKANYWIYPDGGYDHDANVLNYLTDPSAEMPLVYISFPSAKDPDWERRHPNTATVDLITLAPYDWFASWKDGAWRRRGAEYDQLKQSFATRMLETLYRVEPQLRGKLDYHEVSTPLSTRHFLNYDAGEVYGLEHTPQRFAQRFLQPRTPIRRLFLTGQDIVTCGVGGAMMAGVMTASAVRSKNYLKKITTAKESSGVRRGFRISLRPGSRRAGARRGTVGSP